MVLVLIPEIYPGPEHDPSAGAHTGDVSWILSWLLEMYPETEPDPGFIYTGDEVWAKPWSWFWVSYERYILNRNLIQVRVLQLEIYSEPEPESTKPEKKWFSSFYETGKFISQLILVDSEKSLSEGDQRLSNLATNIKPEKYVLKLRNIFFDSEI